MLWYVLSLFLYFPEDKSEYIPSVITLVIFLIAAILTMRFIIIVSKREARKTEELEKRITGQNQRKEEH
ncbi:hypothetical protein CU633_01210 [Bacillus sp. V3-13]|uniref:hypothetical protein n=1 Tax=Bacillus sp. V3-13 TaxID=2053728 RepID=UPI000C76EE73|nr:hypothetical protein [Bacillus sp. V3-13]PLR79375.1 hypothetical protein CU633_01210 [Bacillus sp. V3-13]